MGNENVPKGSLRLNDFALLNIVFSLIAYILCTIFYIMALDSFGITMTSLPIRAGHPYLIFRGLADYKNLNLRIFCTHKIFLGR